MSANSWAEHLDIVVLAAAALQLASSSMEMGFHRRKNNEHDAPCGQTTRCFAGAALILARVFGVRSEGGGGGERVVLSCYLLAVYTQMNIVVELLSVLCEDFGFRN